MALVFTVAAIVLLLWSWPGAAADISKTVEMCKVCHGEAGRPTTPDAGVIQGQHFYYLYLQLKDYKAGRRHNEVMGSIVADLSREELKALAQYFSEQSWPTIDFRVTAEDVARAESAANAGQCAQCHLGGYEGNSGVPRLVGQQPDGRSRHAGDRRHRESFEAGTRDQHDGASAAGIFGATV